MQPRLRAMLPDTIVNYVGRDEAASPATGSMKDHAKEERDIVAQSLDLNPRSAVVQNVTRTRHGRHRDKPDAGVWLIFAGASRCWL